MTDIANIGDWLRQAPVEKTALVFEDGRSWTYSDLDRWANGIAGTLRDQHGVTRGDRVAFLGFNDPAMIALLFACARLGAILAPLNWRLAAAEIGFIVEDCAPKVLFFSDEFEEAAAQCLCASKQRDALEGLDGSDVAREEPGQLSDPLLIVYTSGTTGRPKGAVLSQRALVSNAAGSVDMHRMTAADTVLVVLPLFHVGGLNISLTPALSVGATVHLHSRFDPAETLAATQKIKPQILVLVPATMQAVLQMPDWADADLSSLRMVTTGSMIVALPLIAAWEERGVPVVQVYGSTETCPVAAYTRPGEGRSNPRSTGRAGCESQLRIVDGEGVSLSPGEDGEIEVKGDHVMAGYWRRPEETAAAFRGGWFRSGDIGAMDEEGNLYFKERSKHLIISGGENIYPAEIERVLAAMPGIAECAVCGIPDDKWGEVPAAALVAKGLAAPSGEDVQAILAAKLARFKHPKLIRFLDVLPRNVMGKVVHDDLRAALLGK